MGLGNPPAQKTIAQLRAELASAVECARLAHRRSRKLRIELRSRGALAQPKPPAKPRRPPTPGTARWKARAADLDLLRRAAGFARGYERLIIGNAIGHIESGARHELSPRVRRIAELAAARGGSK
jgi:hypothetical protein